MNDLLANIKGFWDKLSRTQQISFAAGSLAVIVMAGVLAALFTSEDYVPLFDYIKDRREALSVQNHLKEAGFKVQVSEGGHVIAVLSDKREAAHLALAEANSLPDAIPSYAEIMDATSSFGLTEKELDVRINRAKEGSLAKTIMQYRNIMRADVTIERARDSLFSEDQKETSISVIVTMKDALQTMGASQVRTILSLVKHSVLGVSEKNIHISDDEGVDLAALLKNKSAELSHHEMALRKEKELQRKATQTLAEIYGEDNITVQIAVELNFDAKEVESKELAPPVKGEDSGVAISEEKKEMSRLHAWFSKKQKENKMKFVTYYKGSYSSSGPSPISNLWLNEKGEKVEITTVSKTLDHGCNFDDFEYKGIVTEWVSSIYTYT